MENHQKYQFPTYEVFCSELAKYSQEYFKIQSDEHSTNKVNKCREIVTKVLSIFNDNYMQFFNNISYELYEPIIDEWNDRALMLGLQDRFSYKKIFDQIKNKKVSEKSDLVSEPPITSKLDDLKDEHTVKQDCDDLSPPNEDEVLKSYRDKVCPSFFQIQICRNLHERNQILNN